MLNFIIKFMMNKNIFNSLFLFISKIIAVFFFTFSAHSEVVVGSLNAESGSVSKIAEMIIEAQRVVVNYINNDNVGIKGKGLLKIEVADTGCEPIKAVAAANQLINRFRPDILIGPTCSLSAIQIAKEVTIPKDLLLISPSASSPKISLINDKDLVFRTIPSDTQQAYTLAEYLISINIKEVLILYEPDTYNHTLHQIFMQEYTDKGGRVRYKTRLEPGTFVDPKFVNAFVETALIANQPALIMFTYGNERTVGLLQQFVFAINTKIQELGISKIISHYYGTDGMLTDKIKDLIYSYIPYGFNNDITIIAQATSQSSPEFQSYANIMLSAGVNPNSPYSAISFDTMMLIALALQHNVHNPKKDLSIGDSLLRVANPPGIKVGPGEWKSGQSLILRGVDINFEGVSGSMDFDKNGDVEGLYSLNRVSLENTWIVEPLEQISPLFNFQPLIELE
jgi:branched-chain amino acid transport system substrate-binding protein